MSTSVVMMDTTVVGASEHRHRPTSRSNTSNSSSNIGNHNTNNSNNNSNNNIVPINFPRKLFQSNNHQNHHQLGTSASATINNHHTQSQLLSLQRQQQQQQQQPKNLTITAATPSSLQIKLENREPPSPCPADFALIMNGTTSTITNTKTNTSRLPTTKDLAKTATHLTNGTRHITLSSNLHLQESSQDIYSSVSSASSSSSNNSSSSSPINSSVVVSKTNQKLIGTGLATQITNPATILTLTSGATTAVSSNGQVQNGSTTAAAAASPSPPPLLVKHQQGPTVNHHLISQQNSQSPTRFLSVTATVQQQASNLTSAAASTGTAAAVATTTTTTSKSSPSPTTPTNLKRHFDDAFGCVNDSTVTPTSPLQMTIITNGIGHHQMPNTPGNTITGATMVASPTSSSYSDFACKEEMSPSNSVNGYTNVDSLGSDPKKKKGPAPRQQEELCLVCGDRASGYHYNALTCEGCKGFFRRSITKNAVYQCKYGNECEIDMYMRRKCQECRLKKCLSVGMRPECVVPEYQCAMKREAKRAIKDKDKPNSTTKEGLSPNNAQYLIEDKQPLTPSMPINNNWNNTSNGSNDIDICRKLTPEQDQIIRTLVVYQNEYESPSEKDIEKIAPFPNGDDEDDNQKRFQHITEMTILTVQLIVEFSKRVPDFDRLYRDDQITLLKACSSEVMMLRCSRKYDIKTDSIVYANNQPYTRQNYSSACISYVADTLFNFCRRMHMLKVDNAEYALLTAIVIFSDRPHLIEPHKVEEIQEKYIETLRMYVESRSNQNRPPNKCHFAKLLGILTELRTLGNINSEMCISLKVQNKKLPAFLAEIWDIQDS